jgi:hypothetical protein
MAVASIHVYKECFSGLDITVKNKEKRERERKPNRQGIC